MSWSETVGYVGVIVLSSLSLSYFWAKLLLMN